MCIKVKNDHLSMSNRLQITPRSNNLKNLLQKNCELCPQYSRYFEMHQCWTDLKARAEKMQLDLTNTNWRCVAGMSHLNPAVHRACIWLAYPHSHTMNKCKYCNKTFCNCIHTASQKSCILFRPKLNNIGFLWAKSYTISIIVSTCWCNNNYTSM